MGEKMNIRITSLVVAVLLCIAPLAVRARRAILDSLF